MPMYSYKCSASGADFDRFERMADTGPKTQCKCGAPASKVYHSPMAFVESECPAHRAPKTGEWITTNKQRREFMKRNNLVDANDFTPDYIFREQKKRREKADREAAKAYEYLPNGIKPDNVLKEALND